MQPRVTAILVAPGGATYLDRTLDGLSRQTRPPEALVVVDTGGKDSAAGRLSLSGAAQLASLPDVKTFGAAAAHGVRLSDPGDGDPDEWVWLLGHDNAPAPEALERLMTTVEVSPSVAVAGPKLMRWGQPGVIAEFGETVTRYGASLARVENELDQGQHDVTDDVLGVAAGGMLVRRTVWTALGGFDPALPHVDAALDFSIRARLAGHRVVLVPDAKVDSAGPPEEFGHGPVGHARRARLHRAAQLHRRLVYSAAALLPLHWLSLVPLAVVRSVWHLLTKNPGAVVGEFATAFRAAFGGSHVRSARRALARTKSVGWSSVEPLRASRAMLRERRVTERDAQVAGVEDAPDPRASFVHSGGLWVVLVAAVVGVVAFLPLLGNPAVTGGGLLPLSTSVGQLWSSVGYGWREIGTGFLGPSDPFAALVAVLGSLTPWSPSTAVLGVYLVALPLSALGAWFATRRVTRRTWVPAVAAALYALSSPLLSGLQSGHLGAVLAHVALPFLVWAMIGAARSWTAGATASLLFAVVAAAAPSLVPALLVGWLGSIVSRPRGTHRLVAVPLPALALFTPLVVAQLQRGTWWAVFADPGVPTRSDPASPLQLLLTSPETGLNGWTALIAGTGFSSATLAVLVAVAIAPLALLAVASPFVGSQRRAVPALSLALLGYLTAVAATHVSVTGVGSDTTTIWAGSGLSLYLLGLVGAAAVTLDRLPRVAPPVGTLVAVLAVAAAAPTVIASFGPVADVRPSSGRILSAYVTAEAEATPDVGTLVLTPQSDGSLAVSLEHGQGATLDDQSTLDSTAPRLTSVNEDLTVLAGNLVSRSGFDPTDDLRRLGVGFVLLTATDDDGDADRLGQRAGEALDADADFLPVGDTSNGLLWRYVEAQDEREARPAAGPLRPIVLISWGLVFGSALLLAIPTSPRRRRSRAGTPEAEQPATTFDEERDE
ncbi:MULTISPECIES: glycosyltransferase family 2 protein [unclassified Frigoribacterium]|uniref:glycosyltransferase family 2 protein n=1 Tax=unclassified Frigoribacterium TaxID=2627005 RepID=UPI0015670812|nr:MULTISPECIES: glycosyltransferase [unclassified Frigoribacterium]NQW86483.1 glycosyltransferase family 2 protein [Frigoribacterium sp. VKM Ac-2860]NQX07815.1 glycosyltransferase family 2 protein [Frigoribacterium sp. VKM Ac-2859]